MRNKFHIGDMVYAGGWCYGKIVLIQGGYARVEFGSDNGGCNMPFKLSELKHADKTVGEN